MIHTRTEYAITGYDELLQGVFLRFLRKGTSEEFREANQRLLQTMREYSTQRVNLDVLHLGLVSPEDQRWMANLIIPRLAELAPNNYLYIAVVVPESTFTRLAMKSIEDMSNGKGICDYCQFPNLVEAKQWLFLQPSGVLVK
ncbi:hypothetical protein TH61_01495 [Rufibacter sp. DG15C]|uniref:hypothetical protein n=1 Tax=Rufibacter sp. DG15C TaxID=1379909 RepID=UPI00078CA5BF|nr:hypothetical protein [Rufibacter sp. DG15C]AMM50115.1 hypothetical protein TH61_01495 [Rufibacter sp. DG15C]